MDAADLATIARATARPLEPRPTGETPWGGPLRGIRAVLWDVYGTLLISASGDVGSAAAMDSGAAASAACAACDLDPARGPALAAALRPAIEAEHARLRNAGAIAPEVDIRAIWRQVLDQHELRVDDDTLLRLALHYEQRVNPTWTMPGAADCLKTLAARLRLGIVSNAQVFTPLLLAEHLGASLDALGFDPACCVWSYRLRRAKPGPRLFAGVLRHLARRHGIAPWAVAYVGNDLRNDVLCAGRAGCRTVLFAGDARSLRWRRDDPACAGLRPDALVTALDQLPGLLLPAS